ncbi:hypothetical protein [Pseudarthrobacter sp. SSS035]|uniref:hypothetical protein n=1 Tax=Pseudarthrobacter sp. SSS035 TaxID=2931399 RepID=UPI002010A22A|nr:hypothetical protein [Pseudarthrobacter sp. SSS035]
MTNKRGKNEHPSPEANAGVRRRRLLTLGTLVTAFTGISSLSAGQAKVANAAPSVISAEQVPNLSATILDVGGVAFAPLGPGNNGIHHGRYLDAKRAKGGVIGTGGKGVVAFRVDHMLDQHRSTTWPILRDRGMSCGLGVVTGAIGNRLDVEPTLTTWDELRKMHYEGCEIWSHSATHKDPTPYGTTGGLSAYGEIVQPRIDLEAQNLRVMGFQMPGVTGVLDPNYSGNFTTIEQMGSPNGQMFLANYGLIEIDRGAEGARRRLPTDGCFMLGHATLDTMTLAQAKANVDFAVDYAGGVELMFHPKYIGMPGYMTVATFTAVVDYVAAKRDAGVLEVLTPSGLAFADPSSTNRMNLLLQSDFDGITPAGSVHGKWTANNATGVTVETTGGHSGTNFLQFAATSGANYLYQPYTYTSEAGIKGAAFGVEAWVKQPDAVGSGTVRFYLMDNSGSTPAFVIDKRITLKPGQGWTKIRVPFCIPKTCNNLMLRVSRFPDANTGNVAFDEVKLLAI